MRAKVTVEIRPKAGLRDPEGSVIESAVRALGYQAVHDVHVGKAVEFEMVGTSPEDIRTEVDDMCRRILANPVIEDYDIAVRPLPEALHG